MTEDEYQYRIPICCEFQTAEDHAKYMGGCWSISAGYVDRWSKCESCDMSSNYNAKLRVMEAQQ